jgi:secondary thiamine-phosphate synthase enzyme
MRTSELEFDTGGTSRVDLTDHARTFCRDQGDGLLNVFVPHATAGLAIFELGAGSEEDLDGLLERLLPRDDRYRHRHGSAGHGADHLLPVLLSPSVTIPVLAGEPQLGAWQRIVLIDPNRDNARRFVRLSFVGA